MLVGIDSPDLRKLASELRAVDREFSIAVNRELREATKPMVDALKQSGKVNAPDFIDGAALASTVTSSASLGRTAISRRRKRGKPGAGQPGAIDAGYVRHPLFGDKSQWFDTQTPESTGWFSKVAADLEPEVVQRVTAAVLLILNRLGTGNLSTSKVGRSRSL